MDLIGYISHVIICFYQSVDKQPEKRIVTIIAMLQQFLLHGYTK